ncbi:bcl-2-binding component 3 [Paroedura picta]|uniref:bcl-2-binding component 3 n=1 Tax=Paroedura picta TaxID=143630 RepID=UPI004056C1EE
MQLQSARAPWPDHCRRGAALLRPTAAAVPGRPGGAVGGTLALPPPGCRTPLALPPGLNCALCPAGPTPPPRALYRCMRGPEPPRSRSSRAHGSLVALESSPRLEPPTEQALQRTAQPNGHLPHSTLPSLEQALGARLRHMGDQFQREHQRRRQQPQQQQRPVWDHFCHFLFQLLGVFYNLPVEGGRGLGPN